MSLVRLLFTLSNFTQPIRSSLLVFRVSHAEYCSGQRLGNLTFVRCSTCPNPIPLWVSLLEYNVLK